MNYLAGRTATPAGADRHHTGARTTLRIFLRHAHRVDSTIARHELVHVEGTGFEHGRAAVNAH